MELQLIEPVKIALTIIGLHLLVDNNPDLAVSANIDITAEF